MNYTKPHSGDLTFVTSDVPHPLRASGTSVVYSEIVSMRK